ncbi:MAG: phosphatidylglycerophosphatase A [Rhodospirillales bacterium]|jgi:phosphatidylglycerophosphatase A|nr:phosphatidylglycerophosphatase A [Rhodospirillaceae bacterium]MDP6430092.1 phosphatidylglycerophosphatase A [Rhodospirillales bacterium]MDP6643094.1 phosphatidylglycerophosphatase A [Rhodospirillales bacterium]MDP6841993.1 phosphatidylglycerophosphatase A [Rhodospirillales bacterium]|tara:strand:+ start:2788 stop:3252 length:465 start_codon:yes stop_codon:yes gene_type:complete
MNRFAGLIAVFFGAGLLPKAPGTWGSLAALPLAWLIHGWGGAPWLAGATAVLFIIGVWASSVHGRRLGRDDPGEIVVDEVAGQWLTLLVVPADLLLYALGFVLFRFFDIVKPWPVSWADRRIKGGVGIMFDDILAGVYAALGLLLLRYLLGIEV